MSVELPERESDPVGTLLAAPDRASRQELLPAAVEQAAQFATRMREFLTARWAATDPTVVRLAQRMVASIAVHEDIVARWDGVVLEDGDWLFLATDLHRLTCAWAALVEIFLPDEE